MLLIIIHYNTFIQTNIFKVQLCMAAWTPGLYRKHSTSEGFIISQYNLFAIYCQPEINKLFEFGCGRFHVELHFSPGVNCCVQKNLPPGPGFRPHSRNDQSKQHLSRIDQEDSTPDDTPVQSVSPVKGPTKQFICILDL